MKVAIWSVEEQKIMYVVGLAICYKHSVVTTRIELRTKDYEVIRLDDLVDTDKYIVGKEEMKEIIMSIDKEYSDTLDKLENHNRSKCNLL